MKELLKRLNKYELTKGEVLMILNLGLGIEGLERMPPRLRKEAQARDEEGVDKTEEEQGQSDEMVLGVVCEELEQRFGEDDIRGILETVREVVSEFGKGN